MTLIWQDLHSQDSIGERIIQHSELKKSLHNANPVEMAIPSAWLKYTTTSPHSNKNYTNPIFLTPKQLQTTQIITQEEIPLNTHTSNKTQQHKPNHPKKYTSLLHPSQTTPFTPETPTPLSQQQQQHFHSTHPPCTLILALTTFSHFRNMRHSLPLLVSLFTFLIVAAYGGASNPARLPLLYRLID